MKRLKKILIVVVTGVLLLFMALMVVRYFTSSAISNKRYDQLKEQVIETIAEPEIELIIESEMETTAKEELPETEALQSESALIEESTMAVGTEKQTQTVKTIEVAKLDDYMSHSPTITVDYNTLKTMNADYRGWIHMPGSNVSYPVPRGKDNDYYLHKLFETQQYEYAGSLFIDAYSYKLENQDNLIIYGHNMKDGTMFGSLKKYCDQSFFDSHPYIEFHLEDEVRVYLIFSVRTVRSNINALEYQLDSFDVQHFIDSAINESIQYRNINILEGGFENNPYNQILTLSTCVGETSKRLMVNAIRIQ